MPVRKVGLILLTLFLLLTIAGFQVLKTKRGKAQRELADASVVAAFQRDLPIGMTRDEVEAYFVSRKMDYSKFDSVDRVKVREEKGDRLVCDRWFVYVVINFDANSRLPKIAVQRVGHCL